MATTFTRNYFGRHVDPYILDLPEPGFEGAAGLQFQANVKVCSGIQKVAQIYAITLLGAVGSKLVAPTEGTILGDLLLGGVTPLENLIRHIVNIGNAEALAAILANQEDVLDNALEAIPDDELLVQAEIDELTIIDRTQVFVTVNLTTADGADRLFVVPLPLVP
jgi:hypothetical protein